jgi:Zn-dependent M28 family amino/carboxypeptidase
MALKPRAIVFVDAGEYAALASKACPRCELSVAGDLEKRASANVVAVLGSKDPHTGEIIISAHYDSYRGSPGADDNASGVGVLLELARHFAAQGVAAGVRLKFVAFGAEELGVVGSRAYLDAHQPEFARCLLLLNIDQAGGPEGPYVEMTGGVSGIPDRPGENRFPPSVRNRAWEGIDGRWRLVDPHVMERFAVSNRPTALKDLIAKSATAVGCEVTPTGNMGGDQQVFTQAGVVATSIGTSGNLYHGPEDTLDRVAANQLATVGALAAEIARATMEKFARERGGR